MRINAISISKFVINTFSARLSGMAYKNIFLSILIAAVSSGDVPVPQAPVNGNPQPSIQIIVSGLPNGQTPLIRYTSAPTVILSDQNQPLQYTSRISPTLQYSNPVKYVNPQIQYLSQQIQGAPLPFQLAEALLQQAQPLSPQLQYPASTQQQSLQLSSLAPQYNFQRDSTLQPIIVKQASPAEYEPAPKLLSPVHFAAHFQPRSPLQNSSPVQVVEPAVQVPPPTVQAQSAVPVTHTQSPKLPKVIKKEEYDHDPQYAYGYAIEDTQTGDSKRQIEQRQGNFVQGSYSVVDPDGQKRTVEYTADPIHGFNAVVRREPIQSKP